VNENDVNTSTIADKIKTLGVIQERDFKENGES
jgi:hypothetical protein